MRRPKLPPQALRTLEEREQLGQIPEQPGHELRGCLPPPTSEGLCLSHRLGPLGRLIDGLGIGLQGGVISPPSRAQPMTELVDPAALMGRAGGDGLSRCRQSGTAIGHDPLELVAFQATPIEIQQEALPGRVALPGASGAPTYVPRTSRPNAVGHQELDPLAATGPPHPQPDAIAEQIPPVIGQRGLMKLRHGLIKIPRHRGGTDRLFRDQRPATPHGPRTEPA
jgi:hypothetical protein